MICLVHQGIVVGWSVSFESGSEGRNSAREGESIGLPVEILLGFCSRILLLLGSDLHVDQRQTLPEELGTVMTVKQSLSPMYCPHM